MDGGDSSDFVKLGPIAYSDNRTAWAMTFIHAQFVPNTLPDAGLRSIYRNTTVWHAPTRAAADNVIAEALRLAAAGVRLRDSRAIAPAGDDASEGFEGLWRTRRHVVLIAGAAVAVVLLACAALSSVRGHMCRYCTHVRARPAARTKLLLMSWAKRACAVTVH